MSCVRLKKTNSLALPNPQSTVPFFLLQFSEYYASFPLVGPARGGIPLKDSGQTARTDEESPHSLSLMINKVPCSLRLTRLGDIYG